LVCVNRQSVLSESVLTKFNCIHIVAASGHTSLHFQIIWHYKNAVIIITIITSAKEVIFSSLSVCLLATLRKNFQTDLHEIFMAGWQWADEQLIKFWWRSGSPPGYRDCFPDSVLLRDRESLTALQLTSLHHRPTIAQQQLRCTQPRCTHYPVSLAHNIARLVRQGLAEVCTVPVLLVVVNTSQVIFNLITRTHQEMR